MKHKTKGLLTALMAVLLVLAMMPATAFAADYSININDDSMNTSVSSGNKQVNIGGGTITYDPATNTLTLNNVTLTCSDTNNAAIYAPNVSDKDLNLVLKGTNAINAAQCVYVAGNLKISGSGTLNATGTTYGIYANGDLTIDDATVTTSNTHQYNAGIHVTGSVTIQNEATVEASSTGAYGIYSRDKGISINNSKVTASSANRAGMQAATVITITDSNVSASSTNDAGIVASGDITITNSEVNAEGKYPAITGTNVSISGGKVTANATGDQTNAIYATSKLEISNKAVVIAKALNENSYPALFGNDGISVSDSTVTAESGGDGGIFSPATVTIDSGSDVTASGDWAAVCGNEGITISGSTVEATSTNDAGIYSPKTVTIDSGSDITAYSKEQAVCGNGGITISGSKVNATSTNNLGITSTSSVTINEGSEITASGSKSGVYGGADITISGSKVDATSKYKFGIFSSDTVIIEEDSEVTASGGEQAVRGEDGVTISKSKVDATSKNVDATSKYKVAIYSMENVGITDSVVKAQACEGLKGILAGNESNPKTTSASGSWITTSGNESFEGDNSSITNSVLINGTEGKVIGAAVVPGDVTIPEGTTLTVPEGTSLTVPTGVTLTNNGTVEDTANKVTNNGTVVCTNHAGGTPTCSQKAACALCGQEYGDLLAHTVTAVDAKAATCTAEGNIEYWHCTTCDKYYSDEALTTVITEADTKIAKIDHTWDDGKITTEPTYDATGVKTYTCTATGCGATKTEDIPKKERPSVPSGPSVPTIPTDNVTNSGSAGTDSAKTTADINTTLSGSTANAVVDKTTADKIVDKATSNQSAEVVVDAKTSAGTAENTKVTLPTDTVKKIAEKTQAEVTVKTDAAEVTLDQKAVEAVASKAAGYDVEIVVEKTKDETKEMEFELKVVSGGDIIGEFDGGNVKVTVKLNATLAAQKDAALTCVHIDDNGIYSKVGGAKNNDGTYTFVTTHFSSYAIMAEEEADEIIAAQTTEEVKTVELIARTAMSKANGKKAVKVYWYAKDGSELSFDGYEVYRSLKRYEGFGTKPFFKTTKEKYYNTAIKKGTKYYYKVRAYKVIDGEKVYTDWSTKAWRTVK